MSRTIVIALCLVSFVTGYGLKSILERYNIRLIVVEKKRYATKVEEPPMPLAVELSENTPIDSKPSHSPEAKRQGAESPPMRSSVQKPPDKPKGFAFPIDATDLALMKKNIGRSVTVVGEIKDVFHSEKSDTYFIKFSDSRNGFTVVIFKSAAKLFSSRQIDIESLKGKRVKVGGVLKDHPKYGLQFILVSPDDMKVIK